MHSYGYYFYSLEVNWKTRPTVTRKKEPVLNFFNPLNDQHLVLSCNKFLCQSITRKLTRIKWKISTDLSTYYTLTCKHIVLLTTIKMHGIVTRIWMLQGLRWFQEVFNHQRVCFQGVSGEIFPKSVPDFNICAHSLSYFDITSHYPTEQKFKGFSRNFWRNSSFQGLFMRPWNLKLNSGFFKDFKE